MFADQARNVNELDKNQYEKLLGENIIKTYRKAYDHIEDNVNHKLKHIESKLSVCDRVEKMAQRQA